MHLSRRRGSHSPRFNITAMIDITFLLIIFFMTASEFARSDTVPLELPNRKGDALPETDKTIVNVRADGRMLLGARVVGVADLRGPLGAVVTRAGGPDRVRLVVRADRRAPSAAVHALVPLLRSLGLKHIEFSVKEPPPG